MEEEFQNNRGKSDADIADSIKQTTDTIRDTVDEYSQTAQDYYQDAKDTVRTGTKQAADKIKQTGTYADKKVRDNPWGAVGIAAAAGILIGFVAAMCKRSPRDY